MNDRPTFAEEIDDSDDDVDKLPSTSRKKATGKGDEEAEFQAFSDWVNRGIDTLKNAFKEAKDYLIDYGPPYVEAGGLDNINNVTYACSERETSLTKVHRMLTARYSPNIPDPEDFFNTPLIYAAQFGNFFVMQLLLRAKASVQHTNEFGHHALIASVIFYQNPEKRPYQIKIVKLLVNSGADVNMIDKSGHSAIDYCVMNNDLILTRFLLINGARVSRSNNIFVCERKSLLEYALKADPEIYRLIHEKFLEEEEAREEAKSANESKCKEKEEEMRLIKMRARLVKMTSERAAKEEAEQKADNDALLQAFRQSKIDLALKRQEEKALKERGEMREPGGWVKARDGYGWHWDRYYKRENSMQSLQSVGRDQSTRYRKARSKETYEDKWREITGGSSELDVRWHIDEAYLEDDGLTSGESSPEKMDAELRGQDVNELLGLL